jgi:ribosome biogenesis GTPase
VIDTPGLREYGLIGLEPADVGHYFREFRAYIPNCRYPSCTHDHEPDCAVIEALERGEISEVRYRSYVNILDSVAQPDTGR